MTDKQERYAKTLRQGIMIKARRRGFDSDQAHELFRNWGYGNSLRELSIKRLQELKSLLESNPGPNRDLPTKPGTPEEHIKPAATTGPGMATPKQVQYAGILAKRYAELKGIPTELAFEAWHKFVNKYQKIDHIRWCKCGKASQVISVMERVFITTFGADEYHALTGHTWVYRSKRYRKYTDKQPNQDQTKPLTANPKTT